MSSRAHSPPPLLQPVLPPLTSEEIKRAPWRYVGYSGFSKWMASSNDYLVIRRFDSLATRVILLLQWELTKLEDQLAKLDFKLSREVVKDLHNGCFELDLDERLKLIRDIGTKLKEYNDFIISHSEMLSKPNPTDEASKNVKEWFAAYKNQAIDKNEASFIECENDLVAVSPTERTPLRRVFEKAERFRASSLLQSALKPSREILPDHYGLGTSYYHSSKRINHLVNTIICVAGFLMLAVPLWILFYVSSRRDQLIVITAFIAGFLTIVQSVSMAKPSESLAATAGCVSIPLEFPRC